MKRRVDRSSALRFSTLEGIVDGKAENSYQT
jgi:hypothetical protein